MERLEIGVGKESVVGVDLKVVFGFFEGIFRY